MATSTVEDYLKQLCLQQPAAAAKMVPMGRLAAAMGVVPGTATSMVKALADSGLVEYEPRTGVRLTASGRQLALHVLRRHRLVELFLVRVLGLDWSEVHTEADELEHAISDKVLQRMDALLEHPSVDPHGDPIPTARGRLEQRRQSSLADCPMGQSVRVVRVVDQAPAFLQFVDRRGLVPGVVVKVERRDPLADAVIVGGGGRTKGRTKITLGTSAAVKILVEET